MLALTATLNAQTYEVSKTAKPGFTLATLEQAVAVINQVSGLPNALHVNDVRQLVDDQRSYSSLNASGFAGVKGLFATLGINPIVGNFYALGHAEGTFFVQLDDATQATVIRYLSTPTNPKLYVKQIAPAPKPPTPTIDANFLKVFLSMLNESQRAELMKQLVAMGVEVTP